MNNDRRVRFWEKFFVRYFGIPVLRQPPGNWQVDAVKDHLMVLHWCPRTGEYRFDRHYDLLSRAERFRCGGCYRIIRTFGGFGSLAFKIYEAMRIASASRPVFRLPAFFRFFFFGLGRHTPKDRGGRTSGELELEAATSLVSTFFFLYRVH